MIDDINLQIQQLPSDIKEKVSDGYHTFEELYKHRHLLFINLCFYYAYHYSDNVTNMEDVVVKTRKNFEKQEWEGWFLLLLESPEGQISYHLPNEYWEMCTFPEVEYNSKYDGHTSADVLERLKHL